MMTSILLLLWLTNSDTIESPVNMTSSIKFRYSPSIVRFSPALTARAETSSLDIGSEHVSAVFVSIFPVLLFSITIPGS